MLKTTTHPSSLTSSTSVSSLCCNITATTTGTTAAVAQVPRPSKPAKDNGSANGTGIATTTATTTAVTATTTINTADPKHSKSHSRNNNRDPLCNITNKEHKDKDNNKEHKENKENKDKENKDKDNNNNNKDNNKDNNNNKDNKDNNKDNNNKETKDKESRRKSSQSGKLFKQDKGSKSMKTKKSTALTDGGGVVGGGCSSTSTAPAPAAAPPAGTASVHEHASSSLKPDNVQLKGLKSDPAIMEIENNEEDEDDNEDENNNEDGNTTLTKWEDIDANDGDDPQALTEYVNEIYHNLMEKERKGRLDPNYLSNQTDINEKMRSILVDWLVEVHRMFKLLPETLFLCVNLTDRYLAQRATSRDKLQLVGITSMLVAAKFEEIYAPETNDFVYIADGAYTKDQILCMEQTLLNVLSFDLTFPSALHFLRRYSKAAGSDYTLHTLCKYLIEVMLAEVKLLKYVPSQIAAGSVYVARAMTMKTPWWTPTLEHYSTYTEGSVRVVAVEMNDVLKKAQRSTLKAVKKKYSSPKFGQVAEIPIVDL